MADRTFNRNLDPQLRHRLGRFFQDGRNKQGLTQEQLANQVGLTTKTISFIENGKTYPSPENIFRLTKLLNLSLDEFVYGYGRTGESTIIPELNALLEKIGAAKQDGLVRVITEICRMIEE